MADDPKKPYGDVEYADPGYLEDGKKRYPIHDKAHADNAASRFEQNKQRYTPEQQKLILGRIHAAQRKFGEKPDDTQDRSDYIAASGVETRSAGVDGVDFGQRIITVIAVPYERPTKVAYRGEVWNEVFSRSAFNGIETRQQIIPVTAALQVPNPNHEGGHLVGKVIDVYPDSDPGLVTDVKISDTDRGRETLELARDGALSASVGFRMKNAHKDQHIDRYTKTRRINRAFLDHLALVGIPAYPDAKVLAMRGQPLNESELPPMASTPKMDGFLDDPIIRWASGKVRE